MQSQATRTASLTDTNGQGRSRADLTSSLNEEKPSIKPHERQGVSFLLSYSDMALISFRMPPA